MVCNHFRKQIILRKDTSLKQMNLRESLVLDGCQNVIFSSLSFFYIIINDTLHKDVLTNSQNTIRILQICTQVLFPIIH